MEFLYRNVAALGGQRVHRLGLSVNYGLDENGVAAAIDAGVNYFLYPALNRRSREMLAPLRAAFKQRRDKIVVAAVPTFVVYGGSVRRSAERLLTKLGTDYLDVFQLGWLGVTSAWNSSTERELVHLKESGKVRAIGVSIHDRVRAGKLAVSSPLDLFMIRYNAAHPGAEKDIFPHLAARKPAVVAFTATSWRKLLASPKGWGGQLMTAGDCYRFCLSNENVDLVLTGPASQAQLRENLAALQKGPLQPEELAWMRRFGAAVHG